jgi:hypothetical protein
LIELLYIYTGFYYLVDSGYPCTKGYLPPYRDERYHLQQFRSSGDPVGFRELFNYWHSSLRLVIERCFGVLKNRFHVLKGMPKYKVFHQLFVVNACCTIHNFIRLADCDDAFFLYSVAEEVVDNGDDPHDLGFDFSEVAAIAMSNTRDEIAQAIWDNIPHP